MIQEILTYLIVAIAIGISLLRLGKSIFSKKKAMSSSCSSCTSGACGGCSLNTEFKDKPQFPLKVLHQELEH
jgi:hypothetical protein